MHIRPPGTGNDSASAFEAVRERTRGQLPALDGVRGVAVLLVLAIHFGQDWPFRTGADLALRALFGTGWAGVDLFFVLSGFLITGILIETREAANPLRSFYARRFLRIFPLYYAFLVAWFVLGPRVAARIGSFSAIQFGTPWAAWYWSYLCNWIPPGQEVAAIRHLWSLGVEEQFYLCWPFIVRALPGRRLGWLCVALVVGAFGLRLGLLRAGANWFSAYAITPARIDTLAAGAFVAVAIRDERWFALLQRTWRSVVAVSAAGVLIVFGIARGPKQWHPLVQTWGYTLIALGFAAALAGVVLRGSRVLAWPPLRAFGRYSYAIYVLQGIAMIGTSIVAARIPEVASTRLGYLALHLVGGISVTYAMALLSWHLLENPFLRLKRHFEVRHRRPDEDPARSIARSV